MTFVIVVLPLSNKLKLIDCVQQTKQLSERLVL